MEGIDQHITESTDISILVRQTFANEAPLLCRLQREPAEPDEAGIQCFQFPCPQPSEISAKLPRGIGRGIGNSEALHNMVRDAEHALLVGSGIPHVWGDGTVSEKLRGIKRASVRVELPKEMGKGFCPTDVEFFLLGNRGQAASPRRDLLVVSTDFFVGMVKWGFRFIARGDSGKTELGFETASRLFMPFHGTPVEVVVDKCMPTGSAAGIVSSSLKLKVRRPETFANGLVQSPSVDYGTFLLSVGLEVGEHKPVWVEGVTKFWKPN